MSGRASSTVVVTGAGGFVGGVVAQALARRGYNVTAIVRRSKPEGGLSASITWRRGDLTNPTTLPERFESLIHCAAEIPARCPDADALYHRNVDACATVFARARAAGARSVVFMSSMSAFGRIDVHEVREDTPSQDPDIYGRSKLEGERLLREAVAAGLPSGLAIRLPGTIGRGSHDNFLSAAWARIRDGHPVTVRNPGAVFNNVVHAADLAEFLAKWITAPRPGYSMTLLGACAPITFEEVFNILFSASGLPPKVEFVEGGKPPFTIALDRALALGYRPRTVRASLMAFVEDSLAP